MKPHKFGQHAHIGNQRRKGVSYNGHQPGHKAPHIRREQLSRIRVHVPGDETPDKTHKDFPLQNTKTYL